jgi:hypothetical protein
MVANANSSLFFRARPIWHSISSYHFWPRQKTQTRPSDMLAMAAVLVATVLSRLETAHSQADLQPGSGADTTRSQLAVGNSHVFYVGMQKSGTSSFAHFMGEVCRRDCRAARACHRVSRVACRAAAYASGSLVSLRVGDPRAHPTQSHHCAWRLVACSSASTHTTEARPTIRTFRPTTTRTT